MRSKRLVRRILGFFRRLLHLALHQHSLWEMPRTSECKNTQTGAILAIIVLLAILLLQSIEHWLLQQGHSAP
jgi:hypothetical protein